MHQSTDTSSAARQKSLTASVHTLFSKVRNLMPYVSSMSVPQLLELVQNASTPEQLTKAVNALQSKLWKLSFEEQAPTRKKLVKALTTRALYAKSKILRAEAANWLRVLVQTGLVETPEDVFVTLVTATARTQSTVEQRKYLKLIFDCFWPFRFSYYGFSSALFPRNEVFYPLAPLMRQADISTQDALTGIFAELPTLNDPEIVKYIGPVALQWARSTDPERRRRVTNILARMNDGYAAEALTRLQTDKEPVVRASAKVAVASVARA